MGIEYKLGFEHDDHTAILRLLARLPGAGKLTGGSVALEFRDSASSGTPDATLVVEPDGAYFCIHGGQGREMLGRVVSALVGEVGKVTIDDYE